MNQQSITSYVSKAFPEGGFYVEAGAHDGIGDSTTKALADTGLWEGICVEPSSAFIGLKQSRKNDKCHVDNRCLWQYDDQQVVFRQIGDGDTELSGIVECFGDHWDRETRPHTDLLKQTVSLPTLLKEYKAPPVVTFLSLDTEGSEYPILQGHDFTKYRFTIICVEHNGVMSRRRAITGFLNSHGYGEVGGAGVETWFGHKSEIGRLLNACN